MIRASEAKNLVTNSDQNVEKILQMLDPKIRELAQRGERELIPYIDGHTPITIEQFTNPPMPSVLMNLVLAKLKGYGYYVRWEQLNSFAPSRAFGSDPDDDKLYADCGLRIGW